MRAIAPFLVLAACVSAPATPAPQPAVPQPAAPQPAAPQPAVPAVAPVKPTPELPPGMAKLGFLHGVWAGPATGTLPTRERYNVTRSELAAGVHSRACSLDRCTVRR